MHKPDFDSLFRGFIQNPKEKSQNQFVGLCPYPDHQDTNPSFHYENVEAGLFNCFGCGRKGNAQQFAEDMDVHNSEQYRVNSNGFTYSKSSNHTNGVIKPKIEEPEDTPTLDLYALMEQYKDNFKAKWDELPYKNVWKKEIIDEFDVGYSDKELVFAHHNKNAKVINAKERIDLGIDKKTGKSKKAYNSMGDGSCRWYCSHKLAQYSKDKDLYILEGEKDKLTLSSQGYQVTSPTNGCKSIPKDSNGNYDFDPFKDWKGIIFVCYDNDEEGRKGAESLCQKLITEYPSLTIKNATEGWADDLPEGYDVYDSFNNKNGADFWSAIAKWKKVTFKYPEKIGCFDVLTGRDADTRIVKPVIHLVENLLIKGKQNILGGTKGCNKSILSMQMGMAIANNESKVLEFESWSKDARVLYVDTEVGVDEIHRRYDLLKEQFNWNEKSSDTFLMLSKKAVSVADIWSDISHGIKFHKPDLVFFDCLYNMSGGKDMARNHYVGEVTSKITELSVNNNDLTTTTICHANKGNHEQGLVSDRIAGAAALQNWAENIVMITDSNQANLRMLRIDKARSNGFAKCYYGLEWMATKDEQGNDIDFYLKNIGVIENPSEFMISTQKIEMWAAYLDEMKDDFTLTDWLHQVCDIGHPATAETKSQRTAQSYLPQMIVAKMIFHAGHSRSGLYKKNPNMRVIKSDKM